MKKRKNQRYGCYVTVTLRLRIGWALRMLRYGLGGY